MALKPCPECSREVSEKAAFCPGCGYPLEPPEKMIRPWAARGVAGPFEYKSRTRILGLPLIHIVSGPVWLVGMKPAVGIIAVGNIAFGVFALGGFSVGIISLAGMGIGVVSMAGMALGLFAAFGGIAVGYIAVGGIAVGCYAIGGLAVGPHTIYNDPVLIQKIRDLFGLSANHRF